MFSQDSVVTRSEASMSREHWSQSPDCPNESSVKLIQGANLRINEEGSEVTFEDEVNRVPWCPPDLRRLSVNLSATVQSFPRKVVVRIR